MIGVIRVTLSYMEIGQWWYERVKLMVKRTKEIIIVYVVYERTPRGRMKKCAWRIALY